MLSTVLIRCRRRRKKEQIENTPELFLFFFIDNNNVGFEICIIRRGIDLKIYVYLPKEHSISPLWPECGGGFERECEWHVRRDPFQFALAFSYTFNSPQMGN